mmetsp:Transcript_18707/g.71108  ORF Transcript_18707/g.71108 Transcript_18707/m.71108 type:complete len:328 (-) Transcript_18707:1883-2866(-)
MLTGWRSTLAPSCRSRTCSSPGTTSGTSTPRTSRLRPGTPTPSPRLRRCRRSAAWRSSAAIPTLSTRCGPSTSRSRTAASSGPECSCSRATPPRPPSVSCALGAGSRSGRWGPRPRSPAPARCASERWPLPMRPPTWCGSARRSRRPLWKSRQAPSGSEARRLAARSTPTAAECRTPGQPLPTRATFTPASWLAATGAPTPPARLPSQPLAPAWTSKRPALLTAARARTELPKRCRHWRRSRRRLPPSRTAAPARSPGPAGSASPTAACRPGRRWWRATAAPSRGACACPRARRRGSLLPPSPRALQACARRSSALARPEACPFPTS